METRLSSDVDNIFLSINIDISESKEIGCKGLIIETYKDDLVVSL